MSNELVVLPSLRGKQLPDGQIRITRKFVEGMLRYTERWPGKVVAILHPDDAEGSGNLDDVLIKPGSLPFDTKVIAFDSDELLSAVGGAKTVLGGANYLLNRLPEFCRTQGSAYIFNSEYTLRTRCQIVDADTANPVLRARRYAWEYLQERANKAGVRLSAGVQCNGTPTFDAYQELNKRTLLYFDSRVEESMIPSQDEVTTKLATLSARPIRLAFSGRLNRMKGADHLIDVALALREMSVPFTLDICGDGSETAKMEQRIRQHQLSDQVRMHSVLDFRTELMPFIRDKVDLFVCCHRQGDPSCTYIETLACGVPIVGYNNEAFAGLIARYPIGWATPMNQPAQLAKLIASVRTQPDALRERALRGVQLAQEHTADRTFEARVRHMLEVSGLVN